MRILAAAAAVLSISLMAWGSSFRDAHPVTLPPAVDDAVNQPAAKKGDRLPQPFAASQSEAKPPSEPVEPQPLALATEDDLRQAETEHHQHREICPQGRTYFTVNQHRYWRCKL
jgi:hypothetical protein